MKLSAPVYVGLGTVFIVSIAGAWIVPLPDFIKGMVATPGVLALIGALYQLARDSAEFERRQHLQLDHQIFTLGASSHMAKVSFDKHVEFCEAYMKEVHISIDTLFREGPTAQAMDCAGRLFNLRRDYAAWIPKSIALRLDPFEDALRRLGAQTHLVGALRHERAGERAKAIDESFAIFMNVLGLEKLKDTDPDQKQEIAVENVKEGIRSILGITELFEIRSFIVKRSLDFTKSIGNGN